MWKDTSLEEIAEYRKEDTVAMRATFKKVKDLQKELDTLDKRHTMVKRELAEAKTVRDRTEKKLALLEHLEQTKRKVKDTARDSMGDF